MSTTKVTDSVRNVTAVDAAKLTGSIVDARLPATALNSNVDLTALSASNLTSGTLADARLGTVSASKLSGVVPTANLGTGTASSSTFLNGAGAYAEAGGGAWGVKTSGTFSSVSTVTFSGFTKTTRIIIPNLDVTSTGQINGRVGTGAGPTIITSSTYAVDSQQMTAGSSSDTDMSNDKIPILSHTTSTATEPANMEIDIFVPENTTYHTHGRWVASASNAAHNIRHNYGAFRYSAATAVTAFQIYPVSGTISGSYIVLELN